MEQHDIELQQQQPSLSKNTHNVLPPYPYPTTLTIEVHSQFHTLNNGRIYIPNSIHTYVYFSTFTTTLTTRKTILCSYKGQKSERKLVSLITLLSCHLYKIIPQLWLYNQLAITEYEHNPMQNHNIIPPMLFHQTIISIITAT